MKPALHGKVHSFSVSSKDPAFSYDMAHSLAALIQEAEAERRQITAFELQGQAADIERARHA